MEDKASIEIDWGNGVVGISQRLMDPFASGGEAVETSYAQVIAQLAGKCAHDLMKLSPEELQERLLCQLSDGWRTG